MDFVADAAIIRETNQATSVWEQGDIVDLKAIAWLGLPEFPLTEYAASATRSADSDVSVLFAETEALVVITQTCDIIRDCAQRPHVELARLVRLGEAPAAEALRGTRPRFAPVPGAGTNAFADLDLVVTAEKSLLARVSRTPGLLTDGDRRRFAEGSRSGLFAVRVSGRSLNGSPWLGRPREGQARSTEQRRARAWRS